MNRKRAIAKAILLAAAKPALAGAITVNSLADNGPGNCNSACTLRDAIATANPGDTIVFGIGLPWTIVLTGGELYISTPVSIVGPGAGLLSISAASNSRVINVSASNVTISGLTLRDGRTYGAFGAPGDVGQPGYTGGSALGGCVYVHSGAQLALAGVAVTVCSAEAGNGGSGGMGMSGTVGSPGGSGGTGGTALGAIFSSGDLSIVQSSISGCTLTAGAGGVGGSQGYGQNSMTSYAAGNGGVGGAAYGGGVYAAGGTLLVRDSTIGGCALSGGAGGPAGFGAAINGGFAGAGGPASGGSVFVNASVLLSNVEFSTLTGNTLSAGSGANYPAPASGGTIAADALDSQTPSSIKSSIIASVGADPDCAGLLNAQGNNFDQNHACSGFTLHGTVMQTLKPLAANASGTFSFVPIYGRGVIDAAADCALLDNSTWDFDQQYTPRPQGLACDVGAIETDYVFAGGFE